VPVVRKAFRADDKQVAWARRVIEAARAGGEDGGAVQVDGQMIDAPLLRQAEAILASVGE
jgi:citrate lyase subunit beta/citryl-CoA lyase